eukprot:30864-Pelagococcus_subviridis.AAC.7
MGGGLTSARSVPPGVDGASPSSSQSESSSSLVTPAATRARRASPGLDERRSPPDADAALDDGRTIRANVGVERRQLALKGVDGGD